MLIEMTWAIGKGRGPYYGLLHIVQFAQPQTQSLVGTDLAITKIMLNCKLFYSTPIDSATRKAGAGSRPQGCNNRVRAKPPLRLNGCQIKGTTLVSAH